MTVAIRQSLPVNLQGITKNYGAFRALDNVSLDIAPGEFLTLLGPSGSGKTTLLMVLAGFVRPEAGRLMFGSEDVILKPPHKRDVGMVFQNYALFPHMTVAGNVGYPLKLRKVSAAQIKDRIREALDLVELAHLADRGVDQLSGGQRQRVALARAIVFEPQVLLMDEPLSALDKKLRETMQIEIRKLHERLGMTTVYVTHDQKEALTMSDRIAVINDGRIAQLDDPQSLYERPRTKFVADFIGEGSFLPIEAREGRIHLQGRPLQVGPEFAAIADPMLMVRPEKLEILDVDQGRDLNVLNGTVRDAIYQGDSYLIHVDIEGALDDHAVIVRQPTSRASRIGVPEPGGQIALGLHPQDTIIVSGGA